MTGLYKTVLFRTKRETESLSGVRRETRASGARPGALTDHAFRSRLSRGRRKSFHPTREKPQARTGHWTAGADTQTVRLSSPSIAGVPTRGSWS